MGRHGRQRAFRLKGRGADQQLKKHHATGIHVATPVELFAGNLLRRHVIRRTKDHIVFGQSHPTGLTLHKLRQAEVDNPRTQTGSKRGRRIRSIVAIDRLGATTIHQHIGRLQVTVNHTGIVGCLQTCANLRNDADHLGQRQQRRRNQIGVERGPVNVLY